MCESAYQEFIFVRSFPKFAVGMARRVSLRRVCNQYKSCNTPRKNPCQWLTEVDGGAGFPAQAMRLLQFATLSAGRPHWWCAIAQGQNVQRGAYDIPPCRFLNG